MWKAVLAGTTSLVLAGSSLVYAQQQPAAPNAAPNAAPGAAAGPAPNALANEWADHVKALAEARLGVLKMELKLTPEQEKNWAAVQSALQNLAKFNADQEAPPRPPQSAAGSAVDAQPQAADPAANLRMRADELGRFAGILKQLADAVGPFYSSLDDGQKHRFVMLAPPILHEHMGTAGAGDEDGDDEAEADMMDEPGMGGPDMGRMQPGMRGDPGMDMRSPRMGRRGMAGPGRWDDDGMRMGPGMGPDAEMGPGVRPRMGRAAPGYDRRGYGEPMQGYGRRYGPDDDDGDQPVGPRGGVMSDDGSRAGLMPYSGPGDPANDDDDDDDEAMDAPIDE